MYFFFFISFWVSILGAMIAFDTWRRARPYDKKTTAVFSLLTLAGVVWAIGTVLEMLSSDLAMKMFWDKMRYLGMVWVPPLFLVFTLYYLGSAEFVTRRKLALLSIVPITTLLLVLSNEFHNLVYQTLRMYGNDSLLPLVKTYGPWMWAFVPYSHLLIVVATTMIVRTAYKSRELYIRQAITLCCATLLPWINSIIFALGLNPLAFDLTPTLCLISIIAVTLIDPNRLHMGDILPVTHDVIFDRMNDTVIILDSSNRLIDLNKKGEQLIGDQASPVLGRHIQMACPALARYVAQYTEDGGKAKEIAITNRGEARTFDVDISVIADWRGRVRSRVLVLRDITEHKRYSDHLEKLVEERTRQLREAERMATIGELAAMVGHDLRNPLQAITYAVYMLKRSRDTTDSTLRRYLESTDQLQKHTSVKSHHGLRKIIKERVDMIRIIEDSVGYANKIVSDLQDYARPLQPQLAPTSLRELVNDTLSTLTVPKSIVVSNTISDDLPQLIVDSALMKRVFTNLATNALEAMPDGGRLEITSRRTDGGTCISFSDTGVGIPHEHLDRLWKPLFTSKAKGMGFGLAICKRVVEAHGGTISLESTVGEGTTVTITIPLSPKGQTTQGRPHLTMAETLLVGQLSQKGP